MSIYTKVMVGLFIALYGAHSYACFATPEGLYEQQRDTALLLATISVFFTFGAFVIRLLTNRNRIWVTVLWLSVLGYVPVVWYFYSFSDLSHYNGQCGVPGLVVSAKLLLAVSTFILLYEIIICIISKVKNGT